MCDYRHEKKKGTSWKLLYEDPSRQNFLKQVNRKNRSSHSITGLKDEEGLIHLNPDRLAEITQESFKKRLEGLDEPVTTPESEFDMGSLETDDMAGKVNLKELEKILKMMKDGKLKDEQGICYELLKYGGLSLKTYILSWLNDAVSGGGVSKSLN